MKGEHLESRALWGDLQVRVAGDPAGGRVRWLHLVECECGGPPTQQYTLGRHCLLGCEARESIWTFLGQT